MRKTSWCRKCKKNARLHPKMGGLVRGCCGTLMQPEDYWDAHVRFYLDQINQMNSGWGLPSCCCGHTKIKHRLSMLSVNGSWLKPIATECKQKKCVCPCFETDNLKWLQLVGAHSGAI